MAVSLVVTILRRQDLVSKSSSSNKLQWDFHFLVSQHKFSDLHEATHFYTCRTVLLLFLYILPWIPQVKLPRSFGWVAISLRRVSLLRKNKRCSCSRFDVNAHYIVAWLVSSYTFHPTIPDQATTERFQFLRVCEREKLDMNCESHKFIGRFRKI